MTHRTLHVPSRAQTPGPVYLVLHGIGLSHRSFTGLARRLSETGEVVAVDLPGFGSNPRPAHRLSVEDNASIVASELDRRDTGPVVVIGHSMGAQFAVELARQRPDLVSRVVLVGPVVDAGKRTLTAQAIGLAMDSPLEPPATQAMVFLDYLRCGIRWFLTEATAMRDYPIHLAITDVAHPVLVVRGQHDPIADAPWCQWLSGRATDGYLATIPGHRHNVVHSNPEATAAAIIEFVAATQPGRAETAL